MLEADDFSVFIEGQGNMLAGDEKLGVMFYERMLEDEVATRREGRKIFVKREFVKIMVPGDRANVVDRPVQITGILPTDDRMRFPKQYARFKNQQDQKPHDGTPLALWPGIPDTLTEELKYLNIFTVEQLAELSDTHVSKIPRGQHLKQAAAQFVAALKDQAIVNKLQLELESRDAQIKALEQAVAEQGAQIQKLLSGSNKGK